MNQKILPVPSMDSSRLRRADGMMTRKFGTRRAPSSPSAWNDPDIRNDAVLTATLACGAPRGPGRVDARRGVMKNSSGLAYPVLTTTTASKKSHSSQILNKAAIRIRRLKRPLLNHSSKRFSPVATLQKLRCNSIRCEGIPVIESQSGILERLLQMTVFDEKLIDVAPHEASKGVLRRIHNGLAPYVEARVDHHRATGKAFETTDQCVITRIRVLMYGLNPS